MTVPFDDSILDALEEIGTEMARARPGSDERIRGVTLFNLALGYRCYRDALVAIRDYEEDFGSPPLDDEFRRIAREALERR